MTLLRWGEIFNNHLIANFLENVKVKEFWKSASIWQLCVDYVGLLFWPTLYNFTPSGKLRANLRKIWQKCSKINKKKLRENCVAFVHFPYLSLKFVFRVVDLGRGMAPSSPSDYAPASTVLSNSPAPLKWFLTQRQLTSIAEPRSSAHHGSVSTSVHEAVPKSSSTALDAS